MDGRNITLTWRRTLLTTGETPADDVHTVFAQWQERGGAHYLTYPEPENSAPGGESGRVVMRLIPECLTVIRYGWLHGTQRFEPGQTLRSALSIGETSTLFVGVTTHVLVSHVDSHGGHIELSYTMDLDGEKQEILLEFEWAVG